MSVAGTETLYQVDDPTSFMPFMSRRFRGPSDKLEDWGIHGTASESLLRP